MASTSEGLVKRKTTNILVLLKTFYFFPTTGGYGRSGVTDIVGSYHGIFFGIECKANGNRPTALQQSQINAINATGGVAFVVDETTATYDYIYEQLESGRRRIQSGTG